MSHRIEVRSEVDNAIIARFFDDRGWVVSARNADDVDQLWDELGMELAMGERAPTMEGNPAFSTKLLVRVTRTRQQQLLLFVPPRESRGGFSWLTWLLSRLVVTSAPQDEGIDTFSSPYEDEGDEGLKTRRRLAQEGKLACAYNAFRPCYSPACGAFSGSSKESWTLRDRAQIHTTR